MRYRGSVRLCTKQIQISPACSKVIADSSIQQGMLPFGSLSKLHPASVMIKALLLEGLWHLVT